MPINILVKYSDYFNISLDMLCKGVLDKDIKKDKEIREFCHLLKINFEKQGLDIDKLSKNDINKIVSISEFLLKNDFSDEDMRYIILLIKIFRRNQCNRNNIKGFMDIVQLLCLESNEVLSNNRLYEILNGIKKII